MSNGQNMPSSQELTSVSPLAPSVEPIKLSTSHLQFAWEGALKNIGRTTILSVIRNFVSLADGFAYGAHTGELVSDETYQAMTAAIQHAEREAEQKAKAAS